MAEPEELRSRKLPQVVSSAWRAFAPGDLDITSGTEFVFVVHAFYSRTFQNCHSQLFLLGFCWTYVSIFKYSQKNKNIQKTA